MCDGYDGELVKIEDAMENEFVRRLLPNSAGKFWIGLSDTDVEGSFEWTGVINQAHSEHTRAGHQASQQRS
jgi:hypothetical protein